MTQLRLSVFIATISSCSLSLLNAQSQYRFDHYTKKDGLGNDYAYSLAQDSLGYIWIQYFGTLTTFDGYDFNVYRNEAQDSLRSVLNFLMGTLIKDDANNIWIPHHKPGKEVLVEYNRATDGFIKYEIDVGGNNVNRRLFESKSRSVWLGTAGGGLFRHNFSTGLMERFQNGNPKLNTNRNAITGIKNLGSSLLLSTYHGLWLFDKTRNKFSRPSCNPADSVILYSPFTRILSDPTKNNSNTWIRSHRSIVQIDSLFNIIHKFDPPEGVWVGIEKFDVDQEGVIWFGGPFESKTGLYRYDPRNRTLINLKHDPQDPYSLPSDIIYDVLVDRDQNIWVGTDHGISVLRKRSLFFFNKSNKEGTLYATTLYKTKDAEYLIINNVFTEYAENLNKIMMTRLIPGRPDSINLQPVLGPIKGGFVQGFVKGREYFWILQWPEAVIGYPIDYQTGMFKESQQLKKITPNANDPNKVQGIGNIAEGANGNLLVLHGEEIGLVSPTIEYGTRGSVRRIKTSQKIGENLYSRDTQSFWTTSYERNSISIFNQASESVELAIQLREMPYTLANTSYGALLIGTQNALYRANLVGDKYQVESEPLVPNAEVNAIQEDRFGRLWIYADDRIICYDEKKQITTVFGEEDGLEHCRTVYTDWLLQSVDGLMISADPNGISIFDPATFIISQEKINPVFTRLIVNNKIVEGKKIKETSEFILPADIRVTNEITLDYWHNNFSVEFTAMGMVAPKKNRYRHKLEGYDKDWIETDYKNRTATYTNLPSGTYTFRVKASNHHGVWSDNERTLKVIILPPPWRTWWAYSGYGLMVAGLLVWARKNIVQRERLKSSLALAKVEQEKEHFELEKAKEVDKIKTSFFTNISHEFRTPLTLIKGPVQNILDRYKDDPKLQEQLKLVQRNSDLLLKLINQLLDLAKLESGSLKVEKTEGDVFSFVRAIASSFESFARQKNISIQVNVPEGSCPALFDKDKVETILINLINNAVKFTPSGGSVIITASLSPNAQGLVFSVRDTGIGIPPEHQSKIFERFHQVSEAHKEVGTGIGLALVKELVTLMGGEIAVTSEVGVGSEFTVHIPIELVASHQLPVTGDQTPVTSDQPETGNRKPATESTLKEHGQSAKPHILVVEDNTDLRHFIIDSLGSEFHFLEAENGKQGLDIATNEIPDLIISDVMMPEMDGITMAGKIKTDIRTSHVPLILLTAKSSEDSKLSGLSSGADDYLTKPFNKNELLLKVRNRVNRQLKLRERLRAELMSTAPKIEVLSEDEKFLSSVKEKILERLSDEQLSVESLADDMGMSRVQLYRKVSGLTGISVNELIRKLRLQRAAQLLQQKWGPVSQVAYEVGFSNLSYFSKVFKEEFGVLPSEYA